MEIIIVIIGTLIIPTVIICGLILIRRSHAAQTRKKEKLVTTLENIIEMKNKMIKQLKSLR